MTPFLPETIFLIHHGEQKYLKIAAQESKASGNRIILIGNDPKTAAICDDFYDDSTITLPAYDEFTKHYVHLSSAPIEFELLCFKRYFYLHTIAKQMGLEHFWLIDSDAIVLQNLSYFTHEFLIPQGFEAGLSTPIQPNLSWTSSAHTSYWTLEGLEDFIHFLNTLYTDRQRQLLDQKYQWHQEHRISGGICDMTALYLWQKNKASVFNLANAHNINQPFFDNNLNESKNVIEYEFQMVKNIRLKKINHQSGTCYVFPTTSSQTIPVAALHFQGRAKACMATFQRNRQITYWGFAPHCLMQYARKRLNSLKRKLKKYF